MEQNHHLYFDYSVSEVRNKKRSRCLYILFIGDPWLLKYIIKGELLPSWQISRHVAQQPSDTSTILAAVQMSVNLLL